MSLDFLKSRGASDSFGLVADWTHAMNDNADLAEVLNRLMLLVKAESSIITRTFRLNKLTQYIVRCNSQEGTIWPTQARSNVELIFGEFIFSAKVGSIWKLSDASPSQLSKEAKEFHAKPSHLVESVACPLEITRTFVDHIELQFKHQPAEHDLNLLIMLMGTLGAGWARREPGLVSKKLNQRRHLSVACANEANQVSILSTENPARLSRCEFRVCSLLNEGMTVNVIANALSVGRATVRSHLSSIFSKTGAANQVELLHLLNRKSEGNVRAVGL